MWYSILEITKACIADVQKGGLQFLIAQGEQGVTVRHRFFTFLLLKLYWKTDKSVSAFLIKRLCAVSV